MIVLGVAAGCLVAALVYWVGAVVALLALHGIPLGSAGGPPTSTDIVIHFVLAALGAYVGARVAIRISAAGPTWPAMATGALLATFTIASFSKSSSSWPGWFPFGIAASCILGSVLALQNANPTKSRRAKGGADSKA